MATCTDSLPETLHLGQRPGPGQTGGVLLRRSSPRGPRFCIFRPEKHQDLITILGSRTHAHRPRGDGPTGPCGSGDGVRSPMHPLQEALGGAVLTAAPRLPARGSSDPPLSPGSHLPVGDALSTGASHPQVNHHQARHDLPASDKRLLLTLAVKNGPPGKHRTNPDTGSHKCPPRRRREAGAGAVCSRTLVTKF